MKQVTRYDTISFSRYDFEGTIEQVKDRLDEVVTQAKAAGMVGEGRFDIDMYEGYCGGYEVSIVYNFQRAETNAERTAREKNEAAAKAKKDAAARKKKDAEYAQYLRLKKKFGDIEE